MLRGDAQLLNVPVDDVVLLRVRGDPLDLLDGALHRLARTAHQDRVLGERARRVRLRTRVARGADDDHQAVLADDRVEHRAVRPDDRAVELRRDLDLLGAHVGGRDARLRELGGDAVEDTARGVRTLRAARRQTRHALGAAEHKEHVTAPRALRRDQHIDAARLERAQALALFADHHAVCERVELDDAHERRVDGARERLELRMVPRDGRGVRADDLDDHRRILARVVHLHTRRARRTLGEPAHKVARMRLAVRGVHRGEVERLDAHRARLLERGGERMRQLLRRAADRDRVRSVVHARELDRAPGRCEDVRGMLADEQRVLALRHGHRQRAEVRLEVGGLGADRAGHGADRVALAAHDDRDVARTLAGVMRQERAARRHMHTHLAAADGLGEVRRMRVAGAGDERVVEHIDVRDALRELRGALRDERLEARLRLLGVHLVALDGDLDLLVRERVVALGRSGARRTRRDLDPDAGLLGDRLDVLAARADDIGAQRRRHKHRERDAARKERGELLLGGLHARLVRALEDERRDVRLARRARLDLHARAPLLHALEQLAEARELLLREAQLHRRLVRHALDHRHMAHPRRGLCGRAAAERRKRVLGADVGARVRRGAALLGRGRRRIRLGAAQTRERIGHGHIHSAVARLLLSSSVASHLLETVRSPKHCQRTAD